MTYADDCIERSLASQSFICPYFCNTDDMVFMVAVRVKEGIDKDQYCVINRST